MLIDSRIEQLRGGRRLVGRPGFRAGTRETARTTAGNAQPAGRRSRSRPARRRRRGSPSGSTARRSARRRRGSSSMSSITNSSSSVSPASSSSALVTALHGPHHGAQKSTTTGRSARRTSCSKLASVTSRIEIQATDGPRGHGAAAAAPSRSPRARSLRLIFEWPCSRSENEIGTSTTLKPALTTR